MAGEAEKPARPKRALVFAGLCFVAAAVAIGAALIDTEYDYAPWYVPGVFLTDAGNSQSQRLLPTTSSLHIQIDPEDCVYWGNVERNMRVFEDHHRIVISTYVDVPGPGMGATCEDRTPFEVELAEPIGTRTLWVGGHGEPKRAFIESPGSNGGACTTRPCRAAKGSGTGW